MKIIFFWQILQKITRLNKSSLKNQNYILLVGCRLIKTLLLTFLCQNAEGKKALSDILRTYVEENSKFNLDLKTYKENFFDINMPFAKRGDTLINGFKYYDTTTQKEQTIEFYKYYDYVKNFGFT